MTPQQRIESDVKTALKAGEKERLGTLRMLLADLKNERIRAGAEVDEAGFVTVLRKAIKQRADAAEGFRKGDREESAAKEEREAAILEEYLPEQADEADVRAAIEKLVTEEGLSGPQAMGRVMGTMIKKFGASADGATISRIARQVLAD